MQEFRVGAVLGRGFSVFLKNLVPFLFLGLLVYSPLLIYAFVVATGEVSLEKYETFTYVQIVGQLIFANLLSAAVMYGAFQQLRGQHASLGACVSIGLKRFFPVIGVGILVGLATAGGMLLLVVPGIIIACGLFVAVPVAVVERPGVMASLKRSWELTKGYKIGIFGIVLVLGVLNFIAGYVTESVFNIGSASMTLDDLKTYIIVSQFVTLFFLTLQAVVTAVGYHDLRLAKDGINVQELEAVFD